MQLEIEIEAIKRENDKDKLKSLNADISEFKDKRNEINAKWQSEKSVVDSIQNLKTEVETFNLEAEQAERNGDYGKVAELPFIRMDQFY